jgi:LPXTG-motif cell wall-anchored protein
MKKRNIYILVGLVALGGAYFYFRTRKREKIINIDPKMIDLTKKDLAKKIEQPNKVKGVEDQEAKKFRQRIPDALLKKYNTSKEATITRNTNSVTTIKV